MHRVFDTDDLFRLKRPGAFHIGMVASGEHRYPILWVWMPCEGGELHGLPLKRPGETNPLKLPREGASWQWNSHWLKPTLTPSVLTWRDDIRPREEVWHGYITDGRIVSL